MTVHVLPKSAHSDLPSYDVTTGGDFFRPLSPMLLGPVQLYGNMISRNMENAWQYSKWYPEDIVADYWPWALAGWGAQRACRYPAGKGAVPLFSWWAGQELGYVEARKRIYAPLYSHAVRFHRFDLLLELQRLHGNHGSIVLHDFDAYDHRALGYSWDDVMNDPDRKMGHAFVLAMMIEGVL